MSTTPTRRSTFAEGESSNELRRASMIERVVSSPISFEVASVGMDPEAWLVTAQVRSGEGDVV